jgi:hypothetical protein
MVLRKASSDDANRMSGRIAGWGDEGLEVSQDEAKPRTACSLLPLEQGSLLP